MNVPVLSRLEDLPPCACPLLTFTPSGLALLLPDYTNPKDRLYAVPSALLPGVRRALDLLPVLPSPEDLEGGQK